MEKEKKKKTIGGIIGNIVTGLFIVILALAVIGYKGIGGYRYLDILTGSMRPTMPEGTLVVIKKTSAENLKTGDVITFLPSKAESYVTHRIKAVNKDGTFITKGDANNTEDLENVKSSQIAGKVVFKIAYLGAIFMFIQKHSVMFIVLLAFVLFIPDVVRKVVDIVGKDKNEKKK